LLVFLLWSSVMSFLAGVQTLPKFGLAPRARLDPPSNEAHHPAGEPSRSQPMHEFVQRAIEALTALHEEVARLCAIEPPTPETFAALDKAERPLGTQFYLIGKCIDGYRSRLAKLVAQRCHALLLNRLSRSNRDKDFSSPAHLGIHWRAENARLSLTVVEPGARYGRIKIVLRVWDTTKKRIGPMLMISFEQKQGLLPKLREVLESFDTLI
jgi:hypothetical protein